MADVQMDKDLEYARVGDTSLALDLYRPDVPGPVPVVVHLHGGGWQVGDKAEHAAERLAGLAQHGIAVASANYRFASEATYPAQVHDAKAVVRFLRGRAGDLGLAPERIGMWGVSAGAYMASMVGLTAGDAELEGTVGEHLDQSSAVHAVVHWFGQTDLLLNARRSWLEKEILAPPFELALLGVEDMTADPEGARLASPVHRVSSSAPPFLFAHGDQDRVTPVSESTALHQALVRAGVESTLLLLGGAGHEGHEFDRPDHIRMTAAFLLSHLGQAGS